MLKEFEIEPLLKDKAPHQTKAVVAMSGELIAPLLQHCYITLGTKW